MTYNWTWTQVIGCIEKKKKKHPVVRFMCEKEIAKFKDEITQKVASLGHTKFCSCPRSAKIDQS